MVVAVVGTKLATSYAGGCTAPPDQANMTKAYQAEPMGAWKLPQAKLLSRDVTTHACDAHHDSGSRENSRGPWFAAMTTAYRVDRLYTSQEIVAAASQAAAADHWTLKQSVDMPDRTPNRSSAVVEYCKVILGRPATLDLRLSEGANPDQSTRLDVTMQTIAGQSC